MKRAIILLIAYLSQSMSMSVNIGSGLKPLSQEMVDYINSVGTTWKAGHNAYFQGKSMDQIRGLMGALDEPHPSLPILEDVHTGNEDVPEEFDARQKWPNCPTIPDIRDQSNCGSCWAVSAAATISDRVCIGTNGKQIPHISDEDLLSCCGTCGFGCNGGYLGQAWSFWVKSGLVTGGNYTVHDGCQPYPFPPCEHHMEGGQYPQCPQETQPTPACQKSCQEGYDKKYADDKIYGQKSYAITRNEEKIRKEIVDNGPVQAGFTVFEDFLSYKSGVYQHTTGKQLGGHAVKILGFGKENGVPYWLITNTWNSDWGDSGYFKILRGKNECGIEGNIVAGLAKA